MKNISWYLNRLRKMPPLEIPYRIGHKVKEMEDRRGTFDMEFPPTPFHDRLNTLSHHITRQMIPQGDAIIERADQALRNNHLIFGIPVAYGDRIDWHLDPLTRNRWPLEFWAEIDHRNSGERGGVKFVWEINRLDFLPSLGVAYFLTEEARYADKILDVIRSWLAENPYPLGINWVSGIELGLRIANLVWAVSFLSNYRFSDDDYKALNRFIYFHGYHLYRYPSRYSSNNNHALAEAFGLFLAGFYFPHLKHADQWSVFGKTVLEREVSRQILPDGGSFEFTTTYLSFVIDFFLLYRQVCDRHGLPYVKAVSERLERSAEFIAALMDDAGNLPNIGDQDSARLVNFGLDNWENFQSVLNTAGVIFNRPEFLRKGFPDLKTVLLLGEKAFMAMEKRNSAPLHPLTEKCVGRCFKESGLVVIHDKTERFTVHFVGNATPLGMPPLYAHGHLDALSFYLTVDGLEILVDPGTYLYHGGKAFRNYFRSTAAHNTARINQKEFTPQISDFMFGKPYTILENTLGRENGKWVWTASHNAYHQLKPSVAHRRKVVYDQFTFNFEIQDDFRSDGAYYAELFFHFHPACHVSIENNGIVIRREHLHLIMESTPIREKACFRGEEHPVLGWHSHAFNHVTPACVIVLSGYLDGHSTVTTQIRLQANEALLKRKQGNPK